MFHSSDGGLTWSLTQKLTDPNGAVNDRFGWSVSVSGAVLAVGSPYDDAGKGAQSGTAESMAAAAESFLMQFIYLVYISIHFIYLSIYCSFAMFIYLSMFLFFINVYLSNRYLSNII